MTDKKGIRNIGTEYCEANGQLYHPQLVEDYGFDPDKNYTRWIEIAEETAAAHVRDSFWTHRKDREVDLLDPTIYQDVPKDGPETFIVWVADHNLDTRNQLETVIHTDDDDVEAIAITTLVYFPFPEIATVRVFIDSHEWDIDLLLDNNDESNLDHFARTMAQYQEEDV